MHPIASRMWALWDAKDYDRTYDVALKGVIILGTSLYTVPIGTRVPLREGDVLVGFDNQSGALATVELRHVRHSGPEEDGSDEACILRIQVPAHGRALAYHVGGLVEVGLPGRDELTLTCELEGVYAVHAVCPARERMALNTHPDRLLPYHRVIVTAPGASAAC